MRGQPSISAVYRAGPASPRTPEEMDEARRGLIRRLWHDLGLVVLRPQDIGTSWGAELIEAYATEHFGPRPPQKDRAE